MFLLKYFLILIIFLQIIYYREFNNYIDKKFKCIKKASTRRLVSFIPLLILSYIDFYQYYGNTYDKEFFEEFISSKKLNYILAVVGALGVISIIAKDLDVKLGNYQIELLKQEPLLFLICWGAVFKITSRRDEALLGVFFFYIMKYNYSTKRK